MSKTSCTGRLGVCQVLLALLGSAALVQIPAVVGQEVVSFPSADGGVVFADLRGTGDHAVVLVHGGQFDRSSWRYQAEVLTAAGLRTLALDLRGRGRSRGGPGAETDDESAHFDVLGAVHYLRSRGARRVSLVGASYGGGVAARAATELPVGYIDRVVLLAHSPIGTPERIPGRKLFITTRDDFSGNGVPRLPDIREQFAQASDPKALVILEGNAHAQHVFSTDQGPRLMAEILRFLTTRS